MAELQPDSETVCGVDRALVEAFLVLIRDNYREADKATFFLEQRTGILNLQGITNMRDILSHLATLLNPNTPPEKRQEQLGNAEEHLRRAIIEPYEIALNALTVKFANLYDNYKRHVLPARHKYIILNNAPNAISIEASLKEIGELTALGRSGKGKNLWNPEWELGVTSFASAFDKLTRLYAELESHWNNFDQIRRDKSASLLNLMSVLLGLVGVILTVLFFILFPNLPLRLRDVLGLK